MIFQIFRDDNDKKILRATVDHNSLEMIIDYFYTSYDLTDFKIYYAGKMEKLLDFINSDYYKRRLYRHA